MIESTFCPALTRRRMLQGFAGMVASTVVSGCGSGMLPRGGSLSTVKPVSPFQPNLNPQPVPAGGSAKLAMTVGGAAVGTLGEGFVGLAYEKQAMYEPLFTAGNTDLVALFRLLGPSVLRIGGNSVDENVWVEDGKGRTAGQIAPADVDGLAGFLKAAGWRCIYGVNLGGSATGATTPALAAAEVSYVAKALGDALAGVEIGNECENYRDGDSYYAWDWTVQKFEALWLEYRAAIVAETPGVMLVGPAAGSNVSGWTLPWSEAVGSGRMGLMTQHYYRGPAYVASATVEDLVSYDGALVGELAQLRAGAAKVGVPFRMGECNSYWRGGQPCVSDAYASALWAVDMVFQCALGGASGVNFQGGDQGEYALITDTKCVVDGVRPEFYGVLLATLAGQGTLRATQMSVDGWNVTGYAVQASDGSVKIVVVNKEAAQPMELQVELGGAVRAVSSATLLAMEQLSAGATVPSLSATDGVKIQASAVGLDGTFAPVNAYTLPIRGTSVSCYVPALSAVVIAVA